MQRNVPVLIAKGECNSHALFFFCFGGGSKKHRLSSLSIIVRNCGVVAQM